MRPKCLMTVSGIWVRSYCHSIQIPKAYSAPIEASFRNYLNSIPLFWWVCSLHPMRFKAISIFLFKWVQKNANTLAMHKAMPDIKYEHDKLSRCSFAIELVRSVTTISSMLIRNPINFTSPWLITTFIKTQPLKINQLAPLRCIATID